MFFYIGKVIVESGLVSNYISKEINSRLANELGINVKFKELQLEFFPPAISLNDFEAEDFQQNIKVTLGEVEATFGFSLDLISRGKVKKITLSQGEVIINANLEKKPKAETDEKSKFNLAEIYDQKYQKVGKELESSVGSIGDRKSVV